MSVVDFLKLVFRRFVIEQHELMVPEKTRGTAWLNWMEGTVHFENAFDGPSPGASRIRTALQVLSDLGLLEFDGEDIPRLMDPANEIISEAVPTPTSPGGQPC